MSQPRLTVTVEFLEQLVQALETAVACVSRDTPTEDVQQIEDAYDDLNALIAEHADHHGEEP